MTNLLPLAAGSFWFRDPSSTVAAEIDWLYYAILWICIFFFVGIVGAMVALIARYYARPGHKEEHTAHHNNTLEAAWSIFPGLIVIWIFGAGFIGYVKMRTPPADAYEIQVVAKKWNWSFVYPNGYVDADLHVPIDRDVKLVMSSDDVLHSLYIPAFRVKMDVVPGRYSMLWFKATKVAPEKTTDISGYFDEGDGEQPFNTSWEDEGGFDLFCTEYCGQGHSSMLAKVIVHEAGTFGSWLEKAAVWPEDESPVARGEMIYKKRGCSQCHSLDGKSGTGPTYKGVYGTKQMTDKGEVTVDENYIRESILNPMAKIRDGYKGVMPSDQGQLKDHEIAALIYFHKSLNDVDTPATWTEVGGVPGQEPQTEEGAEEAAEGAPADESPAEEASEATEPETADAA